MSQPIPQMASPQGQVHIYPINMSRNNFVTQIQELRIDLATITRHVDQQYKYAEQHDGSSEGTFSANCAGPFHEEPSGSW
ncbi:hypothetical protein K7X08_016327 [Anisodus acutangulus]|uniref:Uncharacterized protein n=1 Tax=Anisodus acutangulus TaxID=402998 RepID=A0A9Q1LGA6_9SOLA|nr:hypothetical protein K7X08_016327 [Anisodus acutangulus]